MERNFATVNQAHVTRKPLATNLLNNSKGAIAMRKFKEFTALIVALALFFTMVQVAPVQAEETASGSAIQTAEDEYDPDDYGVRTSTDSKGVTTVKFDDGKETITIKKNGRVYWGYLDFYKLWGQEVKFIGIDSSKRVYLNVKTTFGDGSFLVRFNKTKFYKAQHIRNFNDIWSPGVRYNKNGYLTKLITENAKKDVNSISKDEIFTRYVPWSYEKKIGKNTYFCYAKSAHMAGILKWKNKKLYWDNKLIAKNVKKKQFGIYEAYIVYIKNNKKTYFYGLKTKKKYLYSRVPASLHFSTTVEINYVWAERKYRG